MASSHDHSRWEELAVGHALSALEPADEEAFVQHVRTCDECARTVAETHEMMGVLSEEVDPVEPTESLRANILAGIAADSTSDESAAAGDPTADGQRGGPVHADELEQRRRRTGRHGHRDSSVRMPWYAAAAVIVLVLVLAAGNVFQLVRNEAEMRQVAEERQEARQVVQCVEEASCRALPMRSTDTESVPVMALVENGRVRLMVDGLRTNDADSTTYVLWQQSGGTLRAVEGFDVTKSGTVIIDAGRLGGSLKDTKFLAVSRERGNQLPEKPSKPLAIGTVSA